MKHAVVAALFVLSCLPLSALAQVPAGILFGGSLEVTSGESATSYPMSVEVYDSPSEGNLIWSDEFGAVAVQGGAFDIVLGADGSLARALTGDVFYVELTVDGETLSPRFPVGTVPYALRAAEASTAAAIGELTDDELSEQLSLLAARVEALEERVAVAESGIEENVSACAECVASDDLASTLEDYTLRTETEALAAGVETAASLAEVITVESAGTDVVFEGVNLHVRSGSGATDAEPNGLGNIIIGYNEDADGSAIRSGSHNVVMGVDNSYSGFGGLISGEGNALSGDNAVCLAGSENVVTGDHSGSVGGTRNLISADSSVCIAGEDNQTTGTYASVTGGRTNRARGRSSSVSGGSAGDANGIDDWRAGDLFETQ